MVVIKRVDCISKKSLTVSTTCENPGCVDTFGMLKECIDHRFINDCN